MTFTGSGTAQFQIFKTNGDPASFPITVNPRTDPLDSVYHIEGSSFGTAILDLVLARRSDGYTDHDEIVFSFIGVDADVDSNNDMAIDPDNGPTGTDDPIEMEGGLPGVILPAGFGDTDADLVPDFADGFNWDDTPNTDDDESPHMFTELVITIPETVDPAVARFKFVYTASDPDDVDFVNDEYVVAAGDLRIWKADGTSQRNRSPANDEGAPGDYIAAGIYTAEQLEMTGQSVTLFIEGIRASDALGDQCIRVEVDPDGPGGRGFVAFDQVAATGEEVNINGDVDRSGTVQTAIGSADVRGKLTAGIIVVANKEEVYTDPDAPAKRREIVVTNSLGPQREFVIKRTSAQSLRLFTAQTGGNDVMAGFNEALITGGTYWLEGGTNPSSSARDQRLTVETVARKSSVPLAVTVLWVDLTGRKEGAISPDPAFDGFDAKIDIDNHPNLGVQLTNPTPQKPVNPRRVSAEIELRGEISPSNLMQDFPTLTSGFDYDGPTSTATADFGFAFHRLLVGRSFANGKYELDVQPFWTRDDSLREWQDPVPDVDAGKLVITDFDGPGYTFSFDSTVPFRQYRRNFIEYVSFFNFAGVPERVSKRLNWAATLDTVLGYSYDNDGNPTNVRPAFFFGAPNTGDNINEVKLVHIDTTQHGIQQVPVLTAAGRPGDLDVRVLKRNEDRFIVIRGQNLLGDVILKKGADEFSPKSVWALVTNDAVRTTDLTELIVKFNIDAAGDGYELLIRNYAGESNAIAGFTIIN